MDFFANRSNVLNTVFGAFLAAVSLIASQDAQATDAIPPCLDENRRPLPLINDAVLQWKASDQREGLIGKPSTRRAYVQGHVSRIFADRNGHDHYEIQIGPNETDTIEVVYNQHFGPTPEPQLNMIVQACGDYIASYAPNEGYEASPSKAIIHWVHRSTGRHASGFVVMDGELCGFGSGAPQRRERNRGRHSFTENFAFGF